MVALKCEIHSYLLYFIPIAYSLWPPSHITLSRVILSLNVGDLSSILKKNNLMYI